VFFPISKIAWYFAEPTNCLVVLGVIGAALLFTGWKRFGRAIATTAAIGLLLIGFSPLPKFIVRPLEDRFPQERAENDPRPVAGIIVLGGAVGFSRGQVAFNEATSRMTEGIKLAKMYPQARLVFTGGDATLIGPSGRTEANAADELFRMAGIDGERIVLEDRSRNTRENALFTSRMVQPRLGERWLLVTSAFHMPRAVGCFRAVGLDLEAYPTDYRTDGDRRDLHPFRHMFNGLQLTDLAVKEWVGLLAYRAAGYTAELLPSPRPAQPSNAAMASDAN
jgi:uncharacterized SAM-binding protein YcdF (DUF218 family)